MGHRTICPPEIVEVHAYDAISGRLEPESIVLHFPIWQCDDTQTCSFEVPHRNTLIFWPPEMMEGSRTIGRLDPRHIASTVS